MKRFTKFAITLLAVGLALFAIPTKKSAPVSSEGRMLNYHAAKGLYEAAGFGEGVAEAQAISSVFPQKFPDCGPAGCYFSSPVLGPDGTGAAPGFAFASDPYTGFGKSGTAQIGWAEGGSYMGTLGSGLGLRYNIFLYWYSGAIGTAGDVYLGRDAANTLAMRNGGTAGAPNPQTFNIYNFCDGAACVTGYERLAIGYAANEAFIDSTAAGTGTVRTIRLRTGGGNRFTVSSTYFAPATTDGYDLGVAGTEYRSLYLDRSIQGSKAKTLTDAAGAVTYATIAVPTNANIGGTLYFTATSTDGANGALTLQADYSFAGADKAGTPTCTISAQHNPITAYSRANTLACTVTNVVNGTNCDLKVTCTDDKAAAQTVTFNGRLDMMIPATVTFP